MHRTSLLSAFIIAILAFVVAGCDGPDNLIELANRPFGYGIFGIVLLILDVIAIVNVLKQNRSTISKLIWILLIVFMPVVGLILYYLFARTS